MTSRIPDFLKPVLRFCGIEFNPVSHAERLASLAGGFCAILAILVVDQYLVGLPAAEIIVASMGASAVLLFAVPHGPLSQPWAVFGGHLVSAVIGVSCARWIADPILAASAAVGLAIGAMHYLRCIHPPGGATALVAVIGGPAIHNLGYHFVVTPVLINATIILLVAVLFNYPFAWRRYPSFLQSRKPAPVVPDAQRAKGQLEHGDLLYALAELDSFVDISEYDLERIYELAAGRAQARQLRSEEISLGHYYSNGEYGEAWSIRQVVDESPHEDEEKYKVIFKVVAGQGRRQSGHVTRSEFARWAKHEVVRDEENWKRVTNDT